MKIVLKADKNVALAAATDYLMADGLANLAKIQTIGDQAKKYLGKEGVSVDGYYIMSRRAKPVPHSATKEKNKDVKYLTARSTKVVFRKRLTDMTNVKNQVLLPLVYGDGVPASLVSKINDAHKALERHQKKAETVKGKVQKQRAAIRAEDDKVFTQSVSMLSKILEAGGIKPADIVVASGMFGKAVLVKLSADNVVSIGKADMARFRAAKKAVAESK